jgi:hypothetical protein
MGLISWLRGAVGDEHHRQFSADATSQGLRPDQYAFGLGREEGARAMLTMRNATDEESATILNFLTRRSHLVPAPYRKDFENGVAVAIAGADTLKEARVTQAAENAGITEEAFVRELAYSDCVRIRDQSRREADADPQAIMVRVMEEAVRVLPNKFKQLYLATIKERFLTAMSEWMRRKGAPPAAEES